MDHNLNATEKPEHIEHLFPLFGLEQQRLQVVESQNCCWWRLRAPFFSLLQQNGGEDTLVDAPSGGPFYCLPEKWL